MSFDVLFCCFFLFGFCCWSWFFVVVCCPVFSHLHVPVYRDMYIAGAGAEWFWGCFCFFGTGTQKEMSSTGAETVRNV